MVYPTFRHGTRWNEMGQFGTAAWLYGIETIIGKMELRDRMKRFGTPVCLNDGRHRDIEIIGLSQSSEAKPMTRPIVL